MFHRWAAPVLVLALCAMTPKHAAGQSTQQPRGHGAGGLGHNYPNPFNPQTFIPFTVGDTSANCANDRQQHVVSVRILNILAQQVAVPVLYSNGTTTNTGSADGQTPLSNVTLSCGAYTAFWNGNLQGTQKEAASGMYIVQLFIDNQPAGMIRIFNRK